MVIFQRDRLVCMRLEPWGIDEYALQTSTPFDTLSQVSQWMSRGD